MRTYTLRKIGKNLIPVVLGVVALSVANSEEADAKEPSMRSKHLVEQPTNQKASTPVTSQQVEKAKTELDNNTQAVKSQESVVNTVHNKANTIKQEIDNTNKEITDLEKIKEQATEENKNIVKDTITNLENSLTTKENTVKEKENTVADKQTEVNNQAEIIKQAQKEVEKAQARVIEAQEKVNTAQKILNGQNEKAIIEELEKSKKELEEAIKNLEEATRKLEEAKEFDKQRQANIDNTKSILDEKTTNEDNKKKELAIAQTEYNAILNEYNKVQANLPKLQEEINAHNTIKLSEDYINNVKIATDFSNSREVRNQAEEKLKSLYDNELANNKYKVNPNDDNITLLDMNNLSLEVRKELSLFASDLVNQIRKQAGTNQTVVTTSSLDFAHKVSNTYIRDNFDPFIKTGHHEEGIKEVAREYGLPQGQYYENWAGNAPYPNKVTLSNLKKLVYERVRSLVIDDFEWLHAQSLLGYNYGKISDEEYLGISLANFNNKASFHLLTIEKDKVAKSTTNNFNTSEIENPKTLDKLQEAYNQALATKNQLDQEKNTKEQAKNTAQTNYTQAQNELRQAIANYNLALSVAEKTPTAQENYNKAETRQAQAQERKETAQTNYDNLSADIKIKEANLNQAKEELEKQQEELRLAKSNLTIEENKLQELNKELEAAKKNLEVAKDDVEKTKQEIKEQKEYLNKLENAPELLKAAQQKLEKLEQRLTIEKEILAQEKALLEDILKEQEKLKATYNDLLIRYTLEQEKIKQTQEQEEKLGNNSNKKDKTLPKTSAKKENNNLANIGILGLIGSLFLSRRKNIKLD